MKDCHERVLKILRIHGP